MRVGHEDCGVVVLLLVPRPPALRCEVVDEQQAHAAAHRRPAHALRLPRALPTIVVAHVDAIPAGQARKSHRRAGREADFG